MAALFILLITVSALQPSSECPAVLDIKSETGCHNSTNNSTYISISCTVSCTVPVITLNGNSTFNFITNEVVTKTCMNSSNVITNCNYLECPVTDPSINITFEKQGFIPTYKLTSCMYTVACKSSKPNCPQKTEKTLLLKECDIMPIPKCSVPSTTVTKAVFNTTTVTMATTVTSSIFEVLPCSEQFTSDDIKPTCDYTTFFDIISTSTVSLIPTSISCNMSSQLPHTTIPTITTTITSTNYSMCFSSVPALTTEITCPKISSSVVNGVKAGIGILVIVLIGLILVTVVMGICLCRSRRQQMDEKKAFVHAATKGQFFKNDQTSSTSLTLERLIYHKIISP